MSWNKIRLLYGFFKTVLMLIKLTVVLINLKLLVDTSLTFLKVGNYVLRGISDKYHPIVARFVRNIIIMNLGGSFFECR